MVKKRRGFASGLRVVQPTNFNQWVSLTPHVKVHHGQMQGMATTLRANPGWERDRAWNGESRKDERKD